MNQYFTKLISSPENLFTFTVALVRLVLRLLFNKEMRGLFKEFLALFSL